MKRYRGLYEKVATMENIEYAYIEARKGKRNTRAVKNFEKDKELLLKKLWVQLNKREYKTSKYRVRTIYEPKERLIHMLPFYPDCIAQHAIKNVVAPIWEPMFIRDSYACIRGRGQHRGSARCMEFTGRNTYVLQCDVSKFYPSIKPGILKEIIQKKIKDRDMLCALYEIIDSAPAIPIGSVMSPWFGNIYLNELDQEAKHKWHIKDYVRYCDDFLLFGTKDELVNIMPKVKCFCEKELRLKLSRLWLYPTKRGIDFLGYRHFPDGKILARKSTAKRIRKQLKALPHLLRRGDISRERARGQLASINGWLKHAKTYHLRCALKMDELNRMVDLE